VRAALLILAAMIGFAQAAFLPAKAEPLATLEDLRKVLQGCFRPSSMSDGQEVTVRFALRADGRLSGPPRITYVKGAPNDAMRKLISDAARGALSACAPLPLTEGLAGAIAGRVFTLRFVGRRALPLT
jgi:hypothetical protein